MNIAAINTVSYGSTGSIMRQLLKRARDCGYQTYGYFGIGNDVPDLKRIGTPRMNSFYSKLSHLTGLMGCFAFIQTHKLIKELRKNKIDIIHLHNLHISFINYGMLFRFIKKNNIRVVWTFHDCWPFTGHCPHFDMIGCSKWIDGCYSCPQYKEYPVSSIDNSKVMWKLKRKWFTDISRLTIITPSQWLSDKVGQSFLMHYNRKVIHNGIDLNVFFPRVTRSRVCDIIPKLKQIVLGVAFDWGNKKGLDIFCKLTEVLDANLYQIVLVGTSDEIDKTLPASIISIHKTTNRDEMAELYSLANVFVNPTREDTFPTVNLEAQACGTPVITFRTGGSTECIDLSCGAVVEKDDLENLVTEIERLCSADREIIREHCVQNAKRFDVCTMYNNYLELYREKMM